MILAVSVPPTVNAPRTSVAVEAIEGIEDEREAWSALAEASGNVFLTWEWLSSWWATFGEGNELVLRLWRRPGGTPAVLLPLYRQPRRPRALRLLGHPQSDLLGPVCAPQDRPAALAALRSVLAHEGAELFVGNAMPVAESWAGELGGVSIEREPSPAMTIGGRDWEEILAQRSSNFRSQMGRVERRLEKEGEVRWRLADAESLERDFETLVRLHSERWDEAVGTFEGPWGELHRRFLPLALERAWLRLLLLELDGEPVGAIYNLRYAGVESFYQSGRDPGRDKLKLGLALQIHAIRAAAEAGVREYRFLRGDEPYKKRFADRDDAVETVAVALRPRARPLTLALRASQRSPALRRRLARLIE